MRSKLLHPPADARTRRAKSRFPVPVGPFQLEHSSRNTGQIARETDGRRTGMNDESSLGAKLPCKQAKLKQYIIPHGHMLLVAYSRHVVGHEKEYTEVGGAGLRDKTSQN
jgi:hypothetical protein